MTSTPESQDRQGRSTSDPSASNAPASSRKKGLTAVALAALLLTGFVLLATGGDTDTHAAHATETADDATQPNEVDIGFAQDMIVHHQQAVTMAQMIDGRVGNQIDGLAHLIETNQLLEIGQLQGSLDLWDEPRFPDEAPMMWMDAKGGHDHAGHTATGMPGMATQSELNSLQDLAGEKLETRFLQLMLRHHQGGLPMTADAAQHAALEPIQGFAQRIAYDQTIEIERISALLKQRNAQPLTPPEKPGA